MADGIRKPRQVVGIKDMRAMVQSMETEDQERGGESERERERN